METLIQLGEILATAFAASWLTRLLTLKSRVKQEGAQAKKAEAEAKKEQIDTIKQLVDDIYKPTIEDLKRQVGELRNEVREVRDENERLRKENAQLRDAIREIAPDSVPSRRSVNASKQPRGKNGQFVKKEDSDVEA